MNRLDIKSLTVWKSELVANFVVNNTSHKKKKRKKERTSRWSVLALYHGGPYIVSMMHD